MAERKGIDVMFDIINSELSSENEKKSNGESNKKVQYYNPPRYYTDVQSAQEQPKQTSPEKSGDNAAENPSATVNSNDGKIPPANQASAQTIFPNTAGFAPYAAQYPMPQYYNPPQYSPPPQYYNSTQYGAPPQYYAAPSAQSPQTAKPTENKSDDKSKDTAQVKQNPNIKKAENTVKTKENPKPKEAEEDEEDYSENTIGMWVLRILLILILALVLAWMIFMPKGSLFELKDTLFPGFMPIL